MRTNIMWALVAGLLMLPAAAQPASAQEEGIKVHGDWVIEVRSPDGTLVNRYEFQNQLVPGAGDIIGRLLGRAWVPSHWIVLLESQDYAASPCQNANGNPSGCQVLEPGEPASQFEGPHRFRNLTVSAPGWMTSGGLRLSGSVTAARTGQITNVRTGLSLCDWGSTAGNCSWSQGGANQIGFTGKILPAPVLVEAGQIVQVTVRFSFSS